MENTSTYQIQNGRPDEKYTSNVALLNQIDIAITGIMRTELRYSIDAALDIGRNLDLLHKRLSANVKFKSAFLGWQRRGKFADLTYQSALAKVRLFTHERVSKSPFVNHVHLAGLYRLSSHLTSESAIDEVERILSRRNDPAYLMKIDEVEAIIRRHAANQNKTPRKPRAPRLADMADDAVSLTARQGRFLRSVTKADIRATLEALVRHVEAGDAEAVEMLRNVANRPTIRPIIAA